MASSLSRAAMVWVVWCSSWAVYLAPAWSSSSVQGLELLVFEPVGHGT